MSTSSITWTPKFPTKGFAIIVMITKPKAAKQIVYPLRHFCKNRAQVDRCLTEIQTALSKEFKGHKIKFAYVVELRFSKDWQLKSDYWSNPGQGFDEELRDKLFVQFINEFTNRQSGWLMLVTPDIKEKKTDHYSVPMPLRLIHRDADTEAFMKYSNWPVDNNATHAAMYTVEDLAYYEIVALKSKPARRYKS